MIVGLDLGTRRVAAACPEIGFIFSVDLDKGEGTARRKRDYPREPEAGYALGRQLCLALIRNGFAPAQELRAQFYFERPLVGRPHGNSRTAIGQGLSAGAVLSQIFPLGDLHQIDNSATWKKELIGHGHSDKDRCRAWLQEHHPALAAVCGQDQDLIDAHCIALWAQLAPRS